MAYTRITAEEAAMMIHDGDNIGFSGFTPNGVPKAVARKLSKRAIREHEAGRPFQVGIITGASSCQSLEGDFANAHAIKFRNKCIICKKSTCFIVDGVLFTIVKNVFTELVLMRLLHVMKINILLS